MKTFLLPLILFILTVLPAQAESFGPSERIRDLMAEEALWIHVHTDYPIPRRPPLVVYLKPHTMMYMYLRDEEAARRYRVDDIPVKALYIEGVMYLPEGYYITRQVIVHELVHHFQRFNDKEYECVGEMEAEAYKLQAKWAREHSEIPEVPGPLYLALVTMCNSRGRV